MLHFLFFFGIFSYLHGPIRTYTFIYFQKKFPPTRLLGTRRLFIFEAKSQLSTWDPCISWFQNSWLSLFCDSVSGTNFLNFQPFHDFQKKNQKKIFFFLSNFYKKLIYIFFNVWIFWLLRMMSIVICFSYFYATRKASFCMPLSAA
jgi:hypothetical protein